MRVVWTIVAELDEPPPPDRLAELADELDGRLEDEVAGELINAGASFAIDTAHDVQL